MDNPTHDPMVIVLACDAAYAMPLATTLWSIVAANQRHWPLVFYVFNDRISQATRQKVIASLPAHSATIEWIPIDVAAFREFSTQPAISKMTYARLMVANLLPNSVSRILFLDTDILVLDDFHALWTTDLNGMILGAVIDGIDPLIKIGTPALAAVPRVSNYFNAGVLLIDLCRWRIERIAEITLDYLHRYPHSPFSDQDAINAACDGRWQALDPRWNYQGHRTVRISNLTGTERPGIVHFITIAKPWCYKSCSLNAAFYDEFRSRTSFARTPPERLADELMSRLFQMHLRLNRYDAWQSTWRLVKRLGTYSRMSDELF